MKNDTKESLCAQVREKYGDTQQEFAVRLGVTIDTIKRWEAKSTPGKTVGHALLLAAQKGTLPATPPRFSEEVEAMNEQEIIELLLRGYGDTVFRFARRIGVSYTTVQNWKSGVFKFSPAGKRLFRHIMEHPEDFIEAPVSTERINAAT